MPFDLGVFASGLIQTMPEYPIVGGGVIVDANGYRHHIFTATTTFQIIRGAPDPTRTYDMLVVGGGGGSGPGAGANINGGGGAGGLFSTSSWALPVGVYTVTVGGGGAVGGSGTASSFGAITVGGGGRGGTQVGPIGESGQPGGSGGGGGSPGVYNNGASSGGLAIGSPAQGVAGTYGNPGSGGFTFNWAFGGGGGGSGDWSMGPKSGPYPTFHGGIAGTGTYFAKYVGLPFGDPIYQGHYASGGCGVGGGTQGWGNSGQSKPGGGGSVFAGRGAPATGGGGGGSPGGTPAGPLGTNTGTGGGGVIILSYAFP